MNYDVNDFDKDVIERSREIPVLVDFWAQWCGPCRILGPVLEKLAQESDGRWALAKVDTERFPDVAAKYGIRSIPNVKLFVDGKVVNEFLGALPEPLVKQWLARALPSKYEKTVAIAEQLLLENNLDAAQNLLEEVVTKEPQNHKALVLLAQTFLQTDPGKAAELVRPIEQDSDFFDVAEAIRTFASLFQKRQHPETLPHANVKSTYLAAIESLRENDFESALQKFIEVIRENRYYDDDGSRKACVAIFKIIGEEHELTKKYRRDFSSALYV